MALTPVQLLAGGLLSFEVKPRRGSTTLATRLDREKWLAQDRRVGTSRLASVASI